ncbi:IS66 family transposase [Alkalicoccus chagannorensis]|uniref:IS66 family transposase n=1 Tax=Alkalicoccus chagannorensis TaxID=427072 RepID=UPI00040F1F5B|nr:transposase [Alkalicoccus chagannorensis]
MLHPFFLPASTIAWSTTQKFQVAIPLYRQAQSMSARGVKLERQTLANNLAPVTEQWIRPMVNLLQAHLLEQDVLHADGTRI